MAAISWRPTPEPDLEAVFATFMRNQHIPGGVVAYGKAGAPSRVFALGTSDPAAGTAMAAGLRFRLASLSKPITAAATMALAKQGNLSLDEQLADIFPEVGQAKDPRYADITIRHLLRHTAGWDRAAAFDPVFDPLTLYAADEAERVNNCGVIARDMLQQPLQFAPGTRQVYSNLGYCWLEQVIARRSGMDYAAFVQRVVFSPRGLTGFHLGEAGLPGDTVATAYEWNGQRHVALPSGAAASTLLHRLSAVGGWIGTAQDYFAFASGLAPSDILAPPLSAGENTPYYGLGWRIWPGDGQPVLSHSGFMPGSFTFAARLRDDTIVVGLFNGGVRRGLPDFDELLQKVRRAVEQN